MSPWGKPEPALCDFFLLNELVLCREIRESGVCGSSCPPPSPHRLLVEHTGIYTQRWLFHVCADGLDWAMATQPAHPAQHASEHVFMGLAANESHLWNICRAAEQAQLRQDISKAWGLQLGCTQALQCTGSCSNTSFWGSLRRLGIQAFPH